MKMPLISYNIAGNLESLGAVVEKKNQKNKIKKS